LGRTLLQRRLGFELKKTGKILEMLGREVRSKRFALAALLIPVFIRAIPEILAGLYPIGWGTITFYIHNPLDWATGKTEFQSAPNDFEGVSWVSWMTGRGRFRRPEVEK